jgi:hypothetical protein
VPLDGPRGRPLAGERVEYATGPRRDRDGRHTVFERRTR